MVLNKTKRETWRSLVFFVGDKVYVDVNRQSNPSYIRAIDKSAVKLLKSTLITLGIVIGSMNLYVGFPVTASLLGKDLQLPIPVLFPFTNYETKFGLIVNLMNNFFAASIGLAGTIGLEIVTSMLKNTVWASTVAIKLAIDEISDQLTIPDRPMNTISCQFRNVLIQTQDLDR